MWQKIEREIIKSYSTRGFVGLTGPENKLNPIPISGDGGFELAGLAEDAKMAAFVERDMYEQVARKNRQVF